MVFLVTSCILVALCSKWIAGKDLSVEPIDTTWRFANVICESSNFILMPGRSYRKADLVRTLTQGETVWLNGWRMVTEDQPDANGNIRFLKTDFIPSYNVMIRKYICEFDEGVFTVNDVPPRSSTDQKRASIYCENSGGSLATIRRQDVKTILDLVQDKVPHWSSDMTSADSIAKQCLAVKRISNGIKYYYEDCDRNLPFVCLQDETTSGIFAPIVSKRYAPFKDFESEIARIASRTTIKMTVEDTTMVQTTKEVIYTTVLEETTTQIYGDESTSQVSDQDTDSETKETFTKPTTVAITVSSTKEGKEYYGLNYTSNPSAEKHTTTPIPRIETASSNDQSSVPLSVTKPTQTIGTNNSYDSTLYEQDTIKPSSVISSNTTSRHVFASADSVKSSSNFISSIDHSDETSFITTTSMSNVLSTTSSYLGIASIQSYKMSRGVESMFTTVTEQTKEMNYSTTTSMSFKTSSELAASISPVSGFSSTLPSASSLSNTQLRYSTSHYQQLKSDPIRGSVIWDRSEMGLHKTATHSLETSSGSIVDETLRIIKVSKVVSDNLYTSDFSIFRDLTATTINIMGSESDYDGQLNNHSNKAEENDTLLTSFIPFKTSSFDDQSSDNHYTKAHLRTVEKQSVSQTSKYVITEDMGLTTSFTSPLISNTRLSRESIDTGTVTETMQNSGRSTVDLYDSSFDYDYNYDYQSTVAASTERTNNLHTKIISQPTPATNASRSNPGDINSTFRDSSYVRNTISPTKTTDIVISDDMNIQNVDTESINRSSRESSKQVDAGPVWIAIGVIGVATVISLCIAVILYKRRRKQKKIADIRNNDTQHPLMNKQEKDTLGTSQPTRDKEKQKNSDQSQHVFVDEAYDL